MQYKIKGTSKLKKTNYFKLFTKRVWISYKFVYDDTLDGASCLGLAYSTFSTDVYRERKLKVGEKDYI